MRSIILLFLALCPILGTAQLVLANGVHLTTSAGTYIVADSGIKINTGSTLALQGTTVKAGVHLQNNGTLSSSNSNLQLTGSIAQQVSGSWTFNDITLNNAAGASINSGTGNSLNVTGTYLASLGTLTANGNLVLKSTAVGTGRIAPIAVGTISGNVTMETYIPGGTRAFRFLGHPFSSVQNMGSLIDNIYITGAGAGFDATATNNPSAYWYDNTAVSPGAWTAFTSTTDNNWARYRGARVLIRGDRTQTTTLTGSNPTPLPVVLDMTGSLNIGNANIALPTAGAYHFIGNPYPSPTDIGTVIDGTANMGSLYWVWKATTAPRGAYIPITVGSGTYNLAMGAAFFVKPTAATTLAFTETNKVAAASNNLFRTANAQHQLELELQYNHVYADKLFVRIDKQAKAAKENLDGDKLMNQDINLYALSADKQALTLDTRPFDSTSIPLGFNTTIASSYSIKAIDNGLDAGIDIYLKDKLLNILTKLETGATYDFEVMAGNAATQGENRFELVMKQAPALLATNSFSVKLSPNPATDLVKVSFSNLEKGHTVISIVDAAGRTVRTMDAGSVQAGEININVKNLAQGNYMVTLDNGKERKTIKLLID